MLDADKAFSVKLHHTGTLDEHQYAFLQCAVLHTTARGQRRVRTCNLALQVAALAGSVFRFADMDTVVAHLLKDCKVPQSISKWLTTVLTGMLR